MFISVLDLFKIGIGPSSSHTLGPMLAAGKFIDKSVIEHSESITESTHIKCHLKGSLAHTGKGHATDRAILLGLHGMIAAELADKNVDDIIQALSQKKTILTKTGVELQFNYPDDIIFDTHETLPEHPNGMVFSLKNAKEKLYSKTFFSIGGGFIATKEELNTLVAPIKMQSKTSNPYPFDSGEAMLSMANESNLNIAQMKWQNELTNATDEAALSKGIEDIWQAMHQCIESGLSAQGILPGGLLVERRAKNLYNSIKSTEKKTSALSELSDTLCAYAMAVNEENAAGHGVVTAPTNGAAGVIPAVLYYYMQHDNGKPDDVRDFLLTAAAIGGIIKHKSSISGAEVGCQGEVGSASAMAAAGLCQVLGGTAMQVENAAEIALEHHLGMTCDPVKGLVQVPCIERNGFGAIKAYTAASLALSSNGKHLVSLDSCIAAMKQTGKEMSEKYKETSLGGLAVTITEC